jgi:hypothetical protein
MLLFESELCQEPASGLDTATKNLTGCRFFSSVAIFCMQGNANFSKAGGDILSGARSERRLRKGQFQRSGIGIITLHHPHRFEYL